ncbi:MAG: polysaccharide deacetylase family protein [Treponema sp.]|nr:polysaccharide deacetylase family protein [Treponema sp.]
MRQTVRCGFIIIFSCLLLLIKTVCYAVPPCTFGGLDVNMQDDLLFTMSQDYKSLFLAHLTKSGLDSDPSPLTCYPESITPLAFSNSLLIRNKNGSAVYSQSEKSLRWIYSSEDFRTINISPDGKWICYVEKEISGHGKLILQSTATDMKVVLVEKISIDTNEVNVKWSPDSSFIVYENSGFLYFFNPDMAYKNVILPEKYRKIGKGSIQNAEWTQKNSLLYIDGDIIYKILESEMYIRGLYSTFVEDGSVIGRLLYAFDSSKDSFWCNSDGSQLVVNTGNKFITYCSINESKYDFVQPIVQQPLSIVPGCPFDCNVFWQNGSAPVLWIDYIRYSDKKKISSVYSLYDKVHLIFSARNSIKPVLSQDRKYVAFSDDANFLIYSLDGWKELLSVKGQEIVSAAWNSSSSIYIGGKESVRFLEFSEHDYAVKKDDKVLFLSAVQRAFWHNDRIVAYTSSTSPAYVHDIVMGTWKEISPSEENNPSPNMLQTNSNFRVFIGESDNINYTNSVYIRTLDKNAFTYPLDGRTQQIVPLRKKASLVFDAVEDAKGIGRILYTLEKYNVCGTFFINGEFIKRYPLETKLLSDSGNVCGSMFFCNVDLLNTAYRVDSDFIRQGLARNEDYFYMATGRELSFLWHAPFNSFDLSIKDAGSKSGYLYVDSDIIEENALVIPLSVGTADRNLEAVIVSLINDGYEFVSILDLIEKSNSISE